MLEIETTREEQAGEHQRFRYEFQGGEDFEETQNFEKERVMVQGIVEVLEGPERKASFRTEMKDFMRTNGKINDIIRNFVEESSISELSHTGPDGERIKIDGTMMDTEIFEKAARFICSLPPNSACNGYKWEDWEEETVCALATLLSSQTIYVDNKSGASHFLNKWFAGTSKDVREGPLRTRSLTSILDNPLSFFNYNEEEVVSWAIKLKILPTDEAIDEVFETGYAHVWAEGKESDTSRHRCDYGKSKHKAFCKIIQRLREYLEGNYASLYVLLQTPTLFSLDVIRTLVEKTGAPIKESALKSLTPATAALKNFGTKVIFLERCWNFRYLNSEAGRANFPKVWDLAALFGWMVLYKRLPLANFREVVEMSPESRRKALMNAGLHILTKQGDEDPDSDILSGPGMEYKKWVNKGAEVLHGIHSQLQLYNVFPVNAKEADCGLKALQVVSFRYHTTTSPILKAKYKALLGSTPPLALDPSFDGIYGPRDTRPFSRRDPPMGPSSNENRRERMDIPEGEKYAELFGPMIIDEEETITPTPITANSSSSSNSSAQTRGEEQAARRTTSTETRTTISAESVRSTAWETPFAWEDTQAPPEERRDLFDRTAFPDISNMSLGDKGASGRTIQDDAPPKGLFRSVLFGMAHTKDHFAIPAVRAKLSADQIMLLQALDTARFHDGEPLAASLDGPGSILQPTQVAGVRKGQIIIVPHPVDVSDMMNTSSTYSITSTSINNLLQGQLAALWVEDAQVRDFDNYLTVSVLDTNVGAVPGRGAMISPWPLTKKQGGTTHNLKIKLGKTVFVATLRGTEILLAEHGERPQDTTLSPVRNDQRGDLFSPGKRMRDEHVDSPPGSRGRPRLTASFRLTRTRASTTT